MWFAYVLKCQLTQEFPSVFFILCLLTSYLCLIMCKMLIRLFGWLVYKQKKMAYLQKKTEIVIKVGGWRVLLLFLKKKNRIANLLRHKIPLV